MKVTRTVLPVLALVLIGCDGDRAIPPTTKSDEEIALGMQCHDRHGLLAMAHGPHGAWVYCYQGRKKIWSVKL